MNKQTHSNMIEYRPGTPVMIINAGAPTIAVFIHTRVDMNPYGKYPEVMYEK